MKFRRERAHIEVKGQCIDFEMKQQSCEPENALHIETGDGYIADGTTCMGSQRASERIRIPTYFPAYKQTYKTGRQRVRGRERSKERQALSCKQTERGR